MSTVFTWRADDFAALLASCDRDDVAPLVREHFPPGATVLECGCGLGRYVRWLTDRGWRAVGYEYLGATLEAVHDTWPDLRLVQCDAVRTPFPTGHFDALLSLGLVEHWPEGPAAVLREHLRVLRPGGVALITVPLHSAVRRWKRALWFDEVVGLPRAIAKRLLRRGSVVPNRLRSTPYPVFPAYGAFYEYRLTPADFARAVRDAGFEVVVHRAIAGIDGIYHELNPFGTLVRFSDWRFRTTPVARALDARLSRRAFAHGHMQAVVARKPR